MIWVELLVVSMGKAEEAVKLIHILAVIWDPNEISEPLFKTIALIINYLSVLLIMFYLAKAIFTSIFTT